MSTSDKAQFMLVVDAGSSSCRAFVYKMPQLEVAAHASRKWLLRADGTMDAGAVLESTEEVIDDVLSSFHAGHEGTISACGFSSFAMSWVGVGADGVAVTPVMTYANRSAAGAAAELQERIGASGCKGLWTETGTPVHPAYLPAQFHEARGQDRTAVAMYGTLVWYLLRRWTGEANMPVSYSEASWTGLLDRAGLKWHEGACRLGGVDMAKLPALCDISYAHKGLTDTYSARWPGLRDCAFFMGIGDGAAANAGTGCLSNASVCISVGTSAAVRTVIPQDPKKMEPPALPLGLWSYRVRGNDHLIGGSLTDGGRLHQWLKTCICHGEEPQIDAVDRVAPNSHGLVVLPFPGGERSVGWHGGAGMTISGMTHATQPVHIVRAVMEALGYRIAQIVDCVRPLCSGAPRIVVSGKVLNENRVWAQIVCDVLGVPLEILEEAESTCMGVAVLIGQCLGIIDPDQYARSLQSETIKPDLTAHEEYKKGRESHQQLYDAVLPPMTVTGGAAASAHKKKECALM